MSYPAGRARGKQMKYQLYFGVALAALTFSSTAHAQSTGSVDFDKNAIVVTATTTKAVGGVEVPDTSKAKGVLTQEFIARQTPGNTILDTINQLPGVNFQNNDPFGSAGGTLSIRGFDSSRISLTFDGVPLNDSGNYAVFSNQQLDPELIENVNVNYGSTDVDSPSAAASGSTVNYRSRTPTDDFHARVLGSVGDFNFFRVFAVLDTGVFTSFGTKAWISGSKATNDWFVNNIGKVNKQQLNAKIYQPIGDNGDFIAIAGNYNENRNNFGGSAPLRTDLVQSPTNPAARTVGTGSANRYPISASEIPYTVARCQIHPGQAGVADVDTNSGCGTTFDERYNPSNTGNIRINSRFTLAPGLVLTVDPSFQYVKANGGGTTQAREGLRDINPAGGTASTALCAITPNSATNTCIPGYFGGVPYVGKDLNGDGDQLDVVNVLAPSQTQTRRYGVLASLRWDVAEGQTLRLNYSFDRARHRQTGEIGFLQGNGMPIDVFPVNNGITTSTGVLLEKRDRLSYATLNQISGEYRGEFFDRRLVVSLGIRAPFFQRDLTNYCFTSSASGFVECFGRDATVQNTITAANPYSVNPATGLPTGWALPQSRTFKYNRVLPNMGFVYKPADHFSVFANYSKGLQVPGTDNLYNAFYFPAGSAQATPVPETTDNFDGGIRYSSSMIQAEIGPWFTRFTNRLASAFDPDTQTTVYRNLGRVDKYGVDASVSVRPIPQLTVYAFGSYLKSEIKSNLQIGRCPATLTSFNSTINCTVAGAPILAATAGKRESGASVYSFGGRIQGNFGPLEIGMQAKRYGRRYLNDQNLPALGCTVSLVNAVCPTAANTPAGPAGVYKGAVGIEYQLYGAYAPGYSIVDLDARLNMAWAGLNKQTYIQFNVQNLFKEFYTGGFSGGSTAVQTIPFAQVALPRTFIFTLNVAY